MYNQALDSGVLFGPLDGKHTKVTDPKIHDERGTIGRFVDDDRAIYYPNDPFIAEGTCISEVRGSCVQYATVNTAERQRTAPQFPDLEYLINENRDDNIRGNVNMEQYNQWLSTNVWSQF